MFYVSRNLETEIYFTHNEMADAGSDSEVLRRLRAKVEGVCNRDYGYLLQVISSAETKFVVQVCNIRSEGIVAKVRFSCISYRPNKNEIIPVIVTEVSDSSIMGKVGPAHVMVPRLKMPQGLSYSKHLKGYEVGSLNSNQTRLVKAGSKILCKCFEVHVDMGAMRIIGMIEPELLQQLFEKEEVDD